MKSSKLFSGILLATVIGASPSAALAWSGRTDLISSSSCRLSNGRLIECSIPARAVSGAVSETAVPLRSTVKVVKSGDCTTQYPLEVSYTFGSEPVVRHQYLRTGEVVLRRRDGGNIPSITVTDVSQWTRNLNVPSTCRISLTFATNTPDVNSKAEAQQIISQLEARLLAKHNEVENLKLLVQYHRAFLFLKSIANNFHAELTNELVQQLRAGAQGALDSLVVLSSACDDQMTDDDRANIMLLLMSLPQLGAEEDWLNPDGTVKTLEDCMGAEARDVFVTVDKLAQQADTAGGSAYDEQLRQAATEEAALKYKVDLAKVQLASWLK